MTTTSLRVMWMPPLVVGGEHVSLAWRVDRGDGPRHHIGTIERTSDDGYRLTWHAPALALAARAMGFGAPAVVAESDACGLRRWPVTMRRLISRGRGDWGEWMGRLGLSPDATDWDVLAASRGIIPTDPCVWLEAGPS